MQNDINEIKITLGKIETDIRHHIKRTDLLEDEIRKWRHDMEPIHKHVGFVNGLGKLSIVLAAISTVIIGALALIK